MSGIEFIEFDDEPVRKMLLNNKNFLKDCEKRNNDKINAGEKITYRAMCIDLGFDVPLGFDPLYDLWGWDKKGFRQLYERCVYLKPL